MPVKALATSLSAPTLSPSTISPPCPELRITTALERAAHDLVQQFCTGRRPAWMLLDVLRAGGTLRLAVEWVRRRRERFALAEVSLAGSEMTWRPCASAAHARAELGRAGGRPGQAVA